MKLRGIARLGLYRRRRFGVGGNDRNIWTESPIDDLKVSGVPFV